MGTLYIVATPIGNREDVTLRALRVLREVAVVAAEDTRHTGQLLAHYGIAARYLSVHEHNERGRAAAVIARLDAGENVALVSDAGTPLLADPGSHLVAEVRAAGHQVVPIPGPSALLAAIAGSGLVPGPFTFVGFLPPKAGARRAALEAVREVAHPVIFYEAPHRLAAMLADALACLGDRTCAVCRELTKLHEEITVTTLAGAVEAIAARVPRGEYVVIIGEAVGPAPAPPDEDTLDALLASLLASGLTPAAAAKEAAGTTGIDRAACYRRAVALRQVSARLTVGEVVVPSGGDDVVGGGTGGAHRPVRRGQSLRER